jgi:membrane fusion protein (multidrug efflux system)
MKPPALEERNRRMAQPTESPLAPPWRSRNAARGLILAAIAGLVLALLLVLPPWWSHGRFVMATNDAYLRADQVSVASKIQGYVEAVLVADNQMVHAGEPLVRIDARNYEALLTQQAAAASGRAADIRAAADQALQQRAKIEELRAQLDGALANARYLAREAARFRDLSDKGVETRDRFDQVENQRVEAEATARADAAALLEGRRQLLVLSDRAGAAAASLKAATAEVASAKLNLGDTLIRASIAGRIGDKNVSIGQFVQPGARLMTVVPVEQIYVVANFKETQIGRMRIGDPAEVKIDALGGRVLKAKVDSLSPGTGSQFALLPAENATGNFTKVVQRVPVRISLETPRDLRGLLIPGLSATVKVDTSAPGPKE